MSAIGGTNGVNFNQQSQPGGFNELSSEEFMEIIFTELQNQDPLDPSDTGALLDQISTIRSIEADLELGNKLDAIVSQNQLATAGALIGKFVAGLSEDFDRVAGYVISVSTTDDGPVLNLDNGYRVPFDQTDELFDPSIFDAEDDPGTDGTGTDGTDTTDDPTAQDDTGGEGAGNGDPDPTDPEVVA